MASNPLLYQLLMVALVLLCLLVHVGLPHDSPRVPKTPLKPNQPRHRRSRASKPFAGLIHQALCEACAHGADPRPKAPRSPPPVITCTRGRRRTVNTPAHFCPAPDCSYYGWLGRGHFRANGHPGAQPWRQLQWICGHGYSLRAAWHDLAGQPRITRPHRPRCRGSGRRVGHPRPSPSVRERGHYPVLAVVGGSRRAAQRLFWPTVCASCRAITSSSTHSMRYSVRSETAR